ncbi:Nitroreductase [Mollisia scopiformis]|uniref:Nitroreductase n=1 Tax=Mollisia scopiformis TaxID=149040 RepID=A0A194XBY9_MOLSC|nr:Nitroreductase [Mollisia scopiformis]KUJ17688.1 Nitroreductase [Mollisia scopiformis]
MSAKDASKTAIEPTLDEAIKNRHSTRKFLPTPIQQDLLITALQFAQLSPSNSNIQPWHLTVVSGQRLIKLKAALNAAATKTNPNIPPLPDTFSHFRTELGYQVYGVGMGIAREDRESRREAVLRNYEFFGAPVVGILCMDKRLGAVDAMGVGMYLQTLLLELTKVGLETCVEVSVAGYPEVLRSELGIGDELDILCGVAIGLEDGEFRANELRIARQPIEKNVVFLEK